MCVGIGVMVSEFFVLVVVWFGVVDCFVVVDFVCFCVGVVVEFVVVGCVVEGGCVYWFE